MWNIGLLPILAPTTATTATIPNPSESHHRNDSKSGVSGSIGLSNASVATPTIGTIGVPSHQVQVVLSGRSFMLSLFHSTSLTNHPHHLRQPSNVSTAVTSMSNTTPPTLLAMPHRVDHIGLVGDHPIRSHFGVQSFLLLSPLSTMAGDSSIVASHQPARRISKNEASVLLSALGLAANASQCILPCFVSIDDPSKHLFWGRTAYGSIVKFDARCTDEIPTSFRHLTGLTDAFARQRERLDGRRIEHTGNMRTLIAASYGFQTETRRWGYNDIGAENISHDSDDDDDDEDEDHRSPRYVDTDDGGREVVRWRDTSEDACIGFGSEWGPRLDPLATLTLSTVWPFFPEGTFVDNAVYSDLDAMAAPHWRLRVGWRSEKGDSPSTPPSDPGADHPAISESDAPLSAALRHMATIALEGTKLASLATVLGNGGAISETPSTLGAVAGGLADSLKAHIDEAKQIAAHGERITDQQIDRIMRELLDIEHQANATSPKSTASSPISPKPQLQQQSSTHQVGPSFPFLPSTPIDPFSTTPYVVSPADPPYSCQLVPFGSLLSRFVIALTDTFPSGRLTLRTVATLWSELVTELRFHFETGLTIPKLMSTDVPDHSMSILHQKIQMLQRCIRVMNAHKKAKSNTSASSSSSASKKKTLIDHNLEQSSNYHTPSPNASTTRSMTASNGWGDLDDLGFGGNDSTGNSGFATSPSAAAAAAAADGWGELDISVDGLTEDVTDDAVAFENEPAPEGVDSIIPNMFLLMHPSIPLRRPITQEPLVLTLDKVEEQAEMFARMGSGADASKLRMELQTKGLASDMSAFKAANPGCVLEDFIRWHSPKDWRPTPPTPSTASKPISKGDSSKSHPRGELSQRMLGAGNIWQQLWKESQPLPAARQTPLFDAAVEGEQVLNYLEHIDTRLLFSHLFGITLQNALCTLARTQPVAERIVPVITQIQKLSHYLKNYNRGNIPEGERKRGVKSERRWNVLSKDSY